MLPTPEDVQKLKDAEGDNESYHSIFDELVIKRLMELDPEWMNAMNQIVEDADVAFWYA